MAESIVGGRAFYFALDVLKLYQVMKNQNEFVISKQLLRCSTSIGANIEEASAAFSRKDFVVKISIASKEARETRYWLKLLDESKMVKDFDFEELINEVNEIIRMLTKIVKTIQNDAQNTNSES